MARVPMPRTAKNADFILEPRLGHQEGGQRRLRRGQRLLLGLRGGRAACGLQTPEGKLYREKRKGSSCATSSLTSPPMPTNGPFVAVPAQREAGVTKAFAALSTGEEASGALLRKELSMGTPVQLGRAGACARRYLNGWRTRRPTASATGRSCGRKWCGWRIAAPGLPRNVAKGLCGRMSAEELQAFRAAFSARAAELLPSGHSLRPRQSGGRAEENSQFKI